MVRASLRACWGRGWGLRVPRVRRGREREQGQHTPSEWDVYPDEDNPDPDSAQVAYECFPRPGATYRVLDLPRARLREPEAVRASRSGGAGR